MREYPEKQAIRVLLLTRRRRCQDVMRESSNLGEARTLSTEPPTFVTASQKHFHVSSSFPFFFTHININPTAQQCLHDRRRRGAMLAHVVRIPELRAHSHAHLAAQSLLALHPVQPAAAEHARAAQPTRAVAAAPIAPAAHLAAATAAPLPQCLAAQKYVCRANVYIPKLSY